MKNRNRLIVLVCVFVITLAAYILYPTNRNIKAVYWKKSIQDFIHTEAEQIILKHQKDTIKHFWLEDIMENYTESVNTITLENKNGKIYKILRTTPDNYGINTLKFYFFYKFNPFYSAQITNFNHDGHLVFLSPFILEHCFFLPTLLDDSTIVESSSTEVSRCSFIENVDLIENTQNTKLIFSDCHFKKNLFIIMPTYNRAANKNCQLVFNECTFNTAIKFNKNVKHSGVKTSVFYSNILFTNDSISGLIDFSNTIFKDSSTIEYVKSTLPDTLNISNVQLDNNFDLTKAYPCMDGGKCELNLIGTNIAKLKLEYENFHLYFPDSLLNNPLQKDIVSSTYEELLRNFQNRHYTKSYEALDIEYKEWQSQFNWQLKVSNVWWKFGYQKERIILVTLILLLIFNLFNTLFYQHLRNAYKVEELDDRYKTIGNNWPKKYWLVLFYTGFIFFKFAIDFKNIYFTHIGVVTYLIVQYTAGLICTGFLINWILKV